MVTKPFAFEGKRRMEQAEQALAELIGSVDTVIVIPNERLMECVEQGTSFFEAFRIADDILRQAVQGIQRHHHHSRHHQPRLRRRENHHVRPGLRGDGHRRASGANRAMDAANRAINSPLLEEIASRARKASDQHHRLLRSRCRKCTKLRPMIQQAAHENANIIFGAVMDEL